MMSLTEVRAYTTTHLAEAAEHWNALADHRESIFGDAYDRARSLSWEGEGAEALREHLEWDYRKAKGSADDLREAANIARAGAGDLDYMHRRVLDKLSEADEAGFAVGEDWSVTSTRQPATLDEHLALQAQAAEFSSDLRQHASDLTAADDRVGSRLGNATAGEGKIMFTDFKQDGGPVCDDPDYNSGILRRFISAVGGGAAVGGLAGAPEGGVGAIPGAIVGGSTAGILDLIHEIAGDGPKCK